TASFAEITLYEHDGFRGRTFASQDRVGNLERQNFNDQASSIIVTGNRWEVCEDVRFGGQCVVLRPGQYPSLNEIGFNDRISSARAIADDVRISNDRYAPEPIVQRDYRARNGERLFETQVTGVRAVMGQPEQRCWMEQQEVAAEQRSSNSLPGGLAGAVIGGILGHQVGGGSGRDLATVGGAVGGAVIGSKIGGRRNNDQARTQEVQRCTTATEAKPAYWDVTYTFRGQQHTAQMATPPGRTITVNRNGEPRATPNQG
ncbi:MAG TPA: beta/gamma crystallin-related protein, partial [Rubrivivax sp.]|nr:beta/gamma crystallin-related protein [Rubrivivax sp.]